MKKWMADNVVDMSSLDCEKTLKEWLIPPAGCDAFGKKTGLKAQ